MRISREQMFMDIAEIVAKRSACLRNNVGAVIVNENNNIVAIGYNGPAAGVPQCTREICHAGCEIAIHAEDNAIQRMPDYNYELSIDYENSNREKGIGVINRRLKIYRLFCTVSPCMHCAQKIINRGDIKEVYYRYEYRESAGIKHLLSNGIKVYKILTGGIINEETL